MSTLLPGPNGHGALAGGRLRPSIASRLRDEHVLLTGGTGFLSRVILEKILRAAPDVGRVYLLVRPNRTRPAGRRVAEQVAASDLFDRLRGDLGRAFAELWAEKVVAVEGDLGRDRLGLGANDYAALADRLTLVINSAATGAFDEELDQALQTNALGPTRLLRLAQEAGNVPLVQVSTCYVNGILPGPNREELPPEGHTPRSLLEGLPAAFDPEREVDELLAECARLRADAAGGGPTGGRGRRGLPALVELGRGRAWHHGWWDTHTFTRSLGERLLARRRGRVPLVIVRPSIVESTYAEPVAGWLDELRVAAPLMAEMGKGRLGRFIGHADTVLDVVPCDFVANAVLAAVPPRDAGPGVRVYQLASSVSNPLRLGEFIDFMYEGFGRHPVHDAQGQSLAPARISLLSAERWRRWLRRREIGLRAGRAACRALGMRGKARRLLLRLRQLEQVRALGDLYAFYTLNSPRFLTDRTERLFESLGVEDRRQFPFDLRHIDWREYLADRHAPGIGRLLDGRGPRAAPEALQGQVAGAATLWEFFDRAAGAYSDQVAVQRSCPAAEGGWLRYTYREFREAAGGVHAALAQHFLEPGDPVAVYGANCPEWVIAHAGVQRGGFVAVPLDPQLTDAQVARAVRFTGARLLLLGTGTRSTAEGLEGQLDACPVLPLAGLVPPPGTAAGGQTPLPVGPAPDQPAALLFTSGTLVRPKAVALSHTNFLANARDVLRSARLGPGERFLSVLPLYHAFEFTVGFLTPFAAGACVTYVADVKRPLLLEAMAATGTTRVVCMPRLLERFAQVVRQQVGERGVVARAVFVGLRLLGRVGGRRVARRLFAAIHRRFGGHLASFACGGSALDPAVARLFFDLGIPVYEGYGLTETGPVLTMNRPGAARIGTVGQALDGVELLIHRPDRDGVGEVLARGPNVAAGYHRDEEGTAAFFVNGWFRTGDLGRLDGSGYLHLTGRLKDVIVLAPGKIVHPDELERLYADLPGVLEVCVLGLSGRGGEETCLVVVPEGGDAGGEPPEEWAVRAAVERLALALPTHQRPHRLVIRPEPLPRTSTLKVKRQQLREELTGASRSLGSTGSRDNLDLETARALPELDDPAAAVLRAALAEVLPDGTRAAAVSPADDLRLDLGIDNLGLHQLAVAVESRHGARVAAEEFQRWVRVADVLRFLRTSRPAQVPPVAVGPPPAPPWFLRPARWAVRSVLALFARCWRSSRRRATPARPL